MKIIESQSAVLSNYEVYAHLSSTAAKPRTTPQTHQNVSTVLKELTDYLSPPPPSRSPIPPYAHPSYSAASVRALVTRLQPYNLTKAELLMILNLRPGDVMLLDCVVEECDERFSTEQQEEIVGIVGEVLGKGEEGGGDGREDMDGVESNGTDGVENVNGGQAEVRGD